MKLLLVTLGSGNGGHSKSALATANALREQGVRITFLVGFETNTAFLKNSGFKFIRLKPCLVPTAEKFLQTLRKSDSFDIVHFFGSPPKAIPFALGASSMGAKFCLTIPGGCPPKSLCGFKNVVAFTDEIDENLKHCVKFEVMPARLQLQEYYNKIFRRKPLLRNAVESFLGCSSDSFVIGRIARVSPASVDEIVETANDVCFLRKSGVDVRYIHMGYAYSYRMAFRVRRTFRKLNDSFGETVVCSIQEPLPDLWTYSLGFDLQVASGRSALEAMICGTPVMQRFGPDRYVIFDKEVLPMVEMHNFTPRSRDLLNPQLQSLLDVKNRLDFNASELRKTYSSFVSKYDAKVAAKFYLRYYLKLKKSENFNSLSSAKHTRSFIEFIRNLTRGAINFCKGMVNRIKMLKQV